MIDIKLTTFIANLIVIERIHGNIPVTISTDAVLTEPVAGEPITAIQVADKETVVIKYRK